jgi:hypothetical protein
MVSDDGLVVRASGKPRKDRDREQSAARGSDLVLPPCGWLAGMVVLPSAAWGPDRTRHELGMLFKYLSPEEKGKGKGSEQHR